MSEVTQPRPETAREDKLRAIAAVFGDAMAARLGAGGVPVQHDIPDADRLAWQTNRLIRHLRDRIDGDTPETTTPRSDTAFASGAAARPAAGDPFRTGGTSRAATVKTRRSRMPTLVAGEDLAAEHPAVIARILKDEPQEIRVSVLRALPGQVARAVMQRLRTS